MVAELIYKRCHRCLFLEACEALTDIFLFCLKSYMFELIFIGLELPLHWEVVISCFKKWTEMKASLLDASGNIKWEEKIKPYKRDSVQVLMMQPLNKLYPLPY